MTTPAIARTATGWRSFVFIAVIVFLSTSASPAAAGEWSWRGEVGADVPDGWTATERGFPNPPPSHVLAMRSQHGDVLVVASVDGQRVAEGLAAHPLDVLLRTYLSSFHDARHTVLTTTEPWSCELAGDVEETAGVVQHVELPNAEVRTVFVCGARDLERGIIVVVIGWRDGHDAPQPPADLLDAMMAVSLDEGPE